MPALAVADALRADGAHVEFIGGERAEAQLVPAAGYQLHEIAVQGLSRSNPLRALRALGLAAVALLRTRRLLAKLAPDAVMGGGGYVAGPVGAAALSLRIPLVLTEADSHLGLTNRLLAPFARRVCLAFALPGRDGARYRVTGRPIPPHESDRAQARAHFGLAPDATCVLVFGGSLGALSINLAAIDAFAEAPANAAAPAHPQAPANATAPPSAGASSSAGESSNAPTPFNVLHITGRRDYPELHKRSEQPPGLPSGYDLREYMDVAEFSQALAASDLVVARSGGSVFEIAAYGRPAILVPYPHSAADHQSANARWMADAGAAVIVPDGELAAERLRAEVNALLSDPERLAAMAAASAALARPRAASDVAAELLAAAGR